MRFTPSRLPAITPDRMFSIIATVVSVSTLSLSFYQSRLNRQQAYASVWPYLIVSNSDLRTDPKIPRYSVIVQNKGVGPAIIDSVEITYNGRPMGNQDQLMAAATPPKDTVTVSTYTTVVPDIVIPAGETVNWMVFEGGKNRQIRTNMNEFAHVRIRYRSVYGERWDTFYNGEKVVEPVKD
jgi:hypothetical protein